MYLGFDQYIKTYTYHTHQEKLDVGIFRLQFRLDDMIESCVGREHMMHPTCDISPPF